MDDDVLSRKTVRHLLLRRRNERIATARDDRMPSRLVMSHDTLAELLADSDPAEAWTLDFEGFEFMGVPIGVDHSLASGIVQVDWPVDAGAGQ